MEENEEDEIDVDGRCVGLSTGQTVVIGQKLRTKTKRKMKELERGIKGEERSLEKELLHKKWGVHSQRWRRKMRRKLMLLLMIVRVVVVNAVVQVRCSSSVRLDFEFFTSCTLLSAYSQVICATFECN